MKMKSIYRYCLCLLACFCMSICCLLAQVPTKEELWEQYGKALNDDIQLKKKNDSIAEEKRKQESIERDLEAIKKYLEHPYSCQNNEACLEQIIALSVNPDLKEGHKIELNQLKSLVERYENEANRFIQIFLGEIKDSRFEPLSQMDVNSLIPNQIVTMTIILEDKYKENGLDSLDFPKEYVYLNEKLTSLREGIAQLKQMDSDAAQMYELLKNIVRIEGELSEEHKNNRQLK
ncbi:hypothetical protein [Bacteroides ndongoniae]|uniref:hypothetical protein n=1 Tax=Bacteroides ndongoniae TaxID=1903262 RepID=UPI0023F9072B|nr:hypothetical protein [Bacteroides ndongoniae]